MGCADWRPARPRDLRPSARRPGARHGGLSGRSPGRSGIDGLRQVGGVSRAEPALFGLDAGLFALALGLDARVHVEELPQRQDQNRQRDRDQKITAVFHRRSLAPIPPADAAGQFSLQCLEGRVEHLVSSDDHIVISGRHVISRKLAHRLANAPPDAVSNHRVAHFAGDGDAKARRTAILAVVHFEQEQPPRRFSPPRAARNSARRVRRPIRWVPAGRSCNGAARGLRPTGACGRDCGEQR
jgi:hypothetical protein